MSARFLPTLLLLALVSAPLGRGVPTDGEVAARRLALELGGAFQDEGFKLRDGTWAGTLALGKTVLIQVNLYAGNEYWFMLGANRPAKKVAVTVFDETGQPVESEPYAGEAREEGATAGAGFSPGVSGPYYVRVALVEGEPAACCLLYSYK